MVRPAPVTAMVAFAAFLLGTTFVAAQTPTADELVARNVAARGGEEKLKSVESVRMSGTVSAQGMEMPLTLVLKRPNLVKQEMTVQNARVVQAYDGQKAWAINPMLGPGPQVIEGLQADALKNQSMIDGPLVGYKQRGDSLEVVGPAEVEGARTWKLKLSRKDGNTMHVFLDAETGLERQWSATTEQNGMTMNVDTIMGDYQPVDGVPMPRSMRTMVDGQQVATVRMTSIEFNVPVDPSEFAMPAK